MNKHRRKSQPPKVTWFTCTTCKAPAYGPEPPLGVFVRECAACLRPLKTKAEAFLAKHPKRPS